MLKNSTRYSLRRILLGKRLASRELTEEKLPKWKALPIFSSDVLSSIGYGPEQIALVLVLPGMILYNYYPWIIAAVIALMLIVTISYSQVIKVHPDGGGSYSITKQYLGEYPALLAGASLCADYALTVAVSVSSGTDALVSAWPALVPYQIAINLVVLFGVLMLINLRGIREASTAFVWPTYAFLIAALALIASGLYQIIALGQMPSVPPAPAEGSVSGPALLFLLLRAFANGCSSMTGVEAIANGSDSFREPRARNAKLTITMMAALLSSLLAGLGFLIWYHGILPQPDQTLLSALTAAVWGRGTGYFIFQLLTMIILYLAANTAYNGLPPLLSFLARDGYMPRYLANRGGRLSYDNGIILLSVAAAALIVIFHGDVEHLISLYALGVFLSFTLAQLSLCVHWRRQSGKNSLLHWAVNAFGALVTGGVVLVIIVTKFMHGAWLILVFLPAMIYLFRRIRAHYDLIAQQLMISHEEYTAYMAAEPTVHYVLLPVASPTRAVARAIRYARQLVPPERIIAVHIATDIEYGEKVRRRWEDWNPDIRLQVVESPYREISEPLIHFVRDFQTLHPQSPVTVLIPEFELDSLPYRFLHNQQGVLLRWQLLNQLDVIVTTVPLQLASTETDSL